MPPAVLALLDGSFQISLTLYELHDPTLMTQRRKNARERAKTRARREARTAAGMLESTQTSRRRIAIALDTSASSEAQSSAA